MKQRQEKGSNLKIYPLEIWGHWFQLGVYLGTHQEKSSGRDQLLTELSQRQSPLSSAHKRL